MRWKMTAANACIVFLVGVVSFVLLREELHDGVASSSARRLMAERAISATAAQLELDTLKLERWSRRRASGESAISVFDSATPQARSRLATMEARRVKDELVKARVLSAQSVSLVAFVDRRGVVLGRDNSTQMRGVVLAESYPSILESLNEGVVLSRFWLSAKRAEQLSVTYSPVRSAEGQVVGALLIGSPLDDETLARLSRRTSGLSLTLGARMPSGTVQAVAVTHPKGPSRVPQGTREATVLQLAGTEVLAGRRSFEVGARVFAPRALAFLGTQDVFIVAETPRQAGRGSTRLLWPLFGASCLGLILVAATGAFFANSIARPVAELEEGLLAVINGQSNHRFELKHPQFGGLVSHLNSLMNLVTGVPEVDHRGRTSLPAGALYNDTDEA